MKAIYTPSGSRKVALNMKDSGAKVLVKTFKFSKTIGNAVASKLGLRGQAHTDAAKEIQRTLRRVRIALEAGNR